MDFWKLMIRPILRSGNHISTGSIFCYSVWVSNLKSKLYSLSKDCGICLQGRSIPLTWPQGIKYCMFETPEFAYTSDKILKWSPQNGFTVDSERVCVCVDKRKPTTQKERRGAMRGSPEQRWPTFLQRQRRSDSPLLSLSFLKGRKEASGFLLVIPRYARSLACQFRYPLVYVNCRRVDLSHDAGRKRRVCARVHQEKKTAGTKYGKETTGSDFA